MMSFAAVCRSAKPILFAAWVVVGASALPVAFAAEPSRKIEFNRDIRPILSENCFACHGPDEKTREADLRLDTQEGLVRRLGEDYPVVPGKPGESQIVLRTASANPDEMMPPPKTGKKLSSAERELLRRWIEEGAVWQGHWSFVPPTRPAAPTIERPGFVRNEIDRFVLARAVQHGLEPSPEADRRSLARRLSFDLVGLPPTAAEVEAFVEDKRPNAYAKYVDRLLASPHFGERMAVYWLDLVRYADSIGYHSDNPRNVAPYRDYVINAFNNNMRFDQFTTEQLAGDLLPSPTLAQRVASGYNRLNMTTEEGGAQPKEYAAKYAADRVRNVSSVWLGVTLGCAECHDHKFDPLSTRDFYQMAAFFADVKEAAVGRREPGLPVPNEEQAAKLAEFDQQITAIQTTLDTPTPELAAAQAQWESSLDLTKLSGWRPIKPDSAKSEKGGKLAIDGAGDIVASGKAEPGDTYTLTFKTKLRGITALRLEAVAEKSLSGGGPGRAGDGGFGLASLSLTAQSAATEQPSVVKLKSATATFAADKLAELISDPSETDASKVAVTVSGKGGKDQQLVVETAEALGGAEDETTALTLSIRHAAGKDGNLGRFRIALNTAAGPHQAMIVKDPPRPVIEALQVAGEKRSDAQAKLVASHYRTIAPSLDAKRAELAAVEKAKTELLDKVPKSLVAMSEGIRTTRILPRGNWQDDSGEVVQPAVPHAFRQLEINDRRANRLDLARWIVAGDNPLVARTFVNRLWKLYFGAGISRRLDDLGAQGQWPTHPDLLDYLATEFVSSGWDVKHVIRLIVNSGAYRQSSSPSKAARQADPENLWFARQTPWRLDAELVRDNALAISGLLVGRLGGESVHPYQPPGYLEYMNFPRREWASDKDENQYRRGLYTFWQRTFLHPSLVAFDASTREECTAERPRSNIPQQALVLLNDPTYVEAARVFAEKAIREPGDAPSRLQWMFRRTVARDANPAEQTVLLTLLDKHRAQYQADAAIATKLLTTGIAPTPQNVDAAELAAWTSVARTLLNLHETITRP